MKPGSFTSGIGMAAGLISGFMFGRLLWAYQQIANKDVPQLLANHTNQAAKGLQFQEIEETPAYTRIHTIQDGIERITYLPKQRRFQTPLLFQHGMWHGAWCWQQWQELLAEWGWESHAHSLPGHGRSHLQRPIPRCTLDYYLGFLQAEINRHKTASIQPVLIGHSMGGALAQWYLKYVGDLQAAVFVASWPTYSTVNLGSIIRLFQPDLVGSLLPFISAKSEYCRSSQSAARLLISPGSLYTTEELFARLGDESEIVLLQHNPPFWRPAQSTQTPLLWLAGELDAGFSVADERRSAKHYHAEFHVIEKAGHNVMIAHNHRQTAELIHNWLVEQGIE